MAKTWAGNGRERELWFGADLLSGGGVLVRVELELVVERDRPQLRVRPEVHLDLDILTRKNHFSDANIFCATFLDGELSAGGQTKEWGKEGGRGAYELAPALLVDLEGRRLEGAHGVVEGGV